MTSIKAHVDQLDKFIITSYGLMSMKTDVATSAVREFLSGGPLGSFIAGESRISAPAGVFRTFDPGTGEALAEIYEATPQDVDDAVGAAKQAFLNSGWANLAPNERAVYLHRLADLVETRKSEIADVESLDVGKPLLQA